MPLSLHRHCISFYLFFYRAEIFLGARPLPPGGRIIILCSPAEASTFIRHQPIQIIRPHKPFTWQRSKFCSIVFFILPTMRAAVGLFTGRPSLDSCVSPEVLRGERLS